MALISCPECRREVSGHAPACPQCGYPIAAGRPAAAAPPVQRIQHEEVNRGFSKGVDKAMEGLGAGVMKALLIGAVVVVGGIALAVRQSMICPDCNGRGKTMLLFQCAKCGGTGWKK